MILEKIKLDLGISGLDSGYSFLTYGKPMPGGNAMDLARLPLYRRTIVHLALC